jgi:hypothetical protein
VNNELGRCGWTMSRLAGNEESHTELDRGIWDTNLGLSENEASVLTTLSTLGCEPVVL